jgi:peptide/nickel transport system permease protein
MGRYALKRLSSALLLALFVSFLSYVLIYAAGDPAVALAGESGSAADAERMRAAYGLDQPIHAQYLHWVWSVLHGNFGRSLYFDQPVSTILAGRLGITMMLGVSAMIFALGLSLPLGIAAARWQGSAVDHLVRAVAVIGQAMPPSGSRCSASPIRSCRRRARRRGVTSSCRAPRSASSPHPPSSG